MFWFVMTFQGAVSSDSTLKLSQIVGKDFIEKRKEKTLENQKKSGFTNVNFDLIRKARLLRGGPTDHAGQVQILFNPNFNIDKSIFRTIDSVFKRYGVKHMVGLQNFWSEQAAEAISAAFLTIPRAPNIDQCLHDFILNESKLTPEHADGSFKDHLAFCYEFSDMYFPKVSPRVLLLHSMMGVATNYFPLTLDKVPKLQSLVTEFEFLHIVAFPSILRLVLRGLLLEEMLSMSTQQIKSLKKIIFHRVIDNEIMELKASDFFINLNYQLIHCLDFLPAASWNLHHSNPTLIGFYSLYNLLKKTDKLFVKMNIDLSQAESSRAGQTFSFFSIYKEVVGTKKLLKMATDQIITFSKKIGHNLDYQLVF